MFQSVPVNGTGSICWAALMNAPMTLSPSGETGFLSWSLPDFFLCVMRVLVSDFTFFLFWCCAAFFGLLPEGWAAVSGSYKLYLSREGRAGEACLHPQASEFWKLLLKMLIQSEAVLIKGS